MKRLAIAGLIAGAAFMADGHQTRTADFELMQAIPQNTDAVFQQADIHATATVWLRMIRQARHTLDIGTFYIANQSGEALEPIVNAIKDAARRGVKVRILTDAMALSGSSDPDQLFAELPQIAIRKIDYHKIGGGVMHAKYMIVDGENIALNSANWSWISLSQIHNVGVRIRNQPLAMTLLSVFNLDWALAENTHGPVNYALTNNTDKRRWVTAQRPAQVSYGDETLLIHPAFSPVDIRPQGTDSEISQMLAAINSANHIIRMQVMTFSGFKKYGAVGYWGELYDAIANAALRGVQVKIIVADWNNTVPAIDFMKALQLMPNVAVKISSIPPIPSRYIPYSRVEHEKYFVVDDDLSWITTSNWEWGYFYNTRDIALLINGHQPANILSALFEADWRGPYTQTLEIDKTYHAPQHS
ncbi:phospholipase D-like domain-containing protein [Edwardsiella piscicida]|uniref:Phospholipase D-like domain-containing protein n=2 Tax=Edwardsiella piscicida TaxID=1263550 RepID=A0AAQ3C2F0_EDWPI|nr:phospholipase D-like domain-containing protein [Edwardsiella piscicida]ACY84133.1 phospholipase D family protein [Edwardsiella tarda EIB202]MDM3865667.1 phospholipase D-like domain-containing protein [Edwardsiella piscicida]UCQ15848.1 phospholipase D-like domain-containing protein [Edwardsiella piscicida]UCQ39045.1 phospholipase D-like domain-containing protein [Edwardsiella piscicida]UCQ42368.1 phospholipase D-like domain-containing protein [Edwardsiella piscicida]